MKATVREQAIAWFESLDTMTISYLFDKYIDIRKGYPAFTGKEIEEIYLK